MNVYLCVRAVGGGGLRICSRTHDQRDTSSLILIRNVERFSSLTARKRDNTTWISVVKCETESMISNGANPAPWAGQVTNA